MYKVRGGPWLVCVCICVCVWCSRCCVSSCQTCPRGQCVVTSWWREAAGTRATVLSTTLAWMDPCCPPTTLLTTNTTSTHSTDTSDTADDGNTSELWSTPALLETGAASRDTMCFYWDHFKKWHWTTTSELLQLAASHPSLSTPLSRSTKQTESFPHHWILSDGGCVCVHTCAVYMWYCLIFPLRGLLQESQSSGTNI